MIDLPNLITRACLSVLMASVVMVVYAGTINGRVTDENNQPIPGATIVILGTQIGAVADANGRFTIENITNGEYEIEISSVGYSKTRKAIRLKGSKPVKLQIRLEENVEELNTVVVSGKSESRVLSEQPLQISSIDMVSLQTEASDMVRVLDRTAGVRVRQSGGLGSSTIIQLNGLTGQAVRLYYDGIPLELLSGSVQINNLPVNSIERVDVYKGVMPVDVGTDALAGGINIISRQVDRKYLDASYQFGSFNTHIASVNAADKWGDHFVASVSGFFNYSDNDYKMRAIQWVNYNEEEVIATRLHSAHRSSMIRANVELNNVRWADKLVYGASFNQRFDEIQHGVRLGNKGVGEADVERNAFIQDVRFEKALLDEKFGIKYFGSFALAKEFIRDSTDVFYDWFGNVMDLPNSQGFEVFGSPTLRDGKTQSHFHRLTLKYDFLPSQTLKVSSLYSYQDVRGEDPATEEILGFDPNQIPSFLQRSITGLSYEAKWFKSKLETVLYGKYYHYDQRTSDFQIGRSDVPFEYSQQDQTTGYGFGFKYLIRPDVFVRASFEEAVRIPNKDEVFGNFITIQPNFFLTPERSKNLNLGGYFKHSFTAYQFVSLDANFFLRDQRDLIRLQPGRNENDPGQYVNEEKAEAQGMELTMSVVPVKNLEFRTNFTFQKIVKGGEKDLNDTNGAGDPIPNIPNRFYNISVRYSFNNPMAQKDELTVFGYYNFVKEFDLIFQGEGDRNLENIIPTQKQLDAGLSYRIGNSGVTTSFQVNNLLDREVFDNYRVPRPGRNYSLKIRYLFQKI